MMLLLSTSTSGLLGPWAVGADGLMGREGATAQRASTLDNGWRCGRASDSAEAGGADLVLSCTIV